MTREIDDNEEKLVKFDESEISGRPLSETEIKELRKLLELERNKKWLRATMWTWSRTILITIGSVYFVREWLWELLQAVSRAIK